jgi:hypothetical protein
MTLCLLAGCGGSAYPVSGTVKVKGGEVLKQGNVQFISDQHTASGMIGQDGRYTLSSSGAGDGAPAGKYKVIFLSTEVGGGYDNPDEPVKPVIDSKYANPTTTPIEVEVPGSGSYDFELDPPGADSPAEG